MAQISYVQPRYKRQARQVAITEKLHAVERVSNGETKAAVSRDIGVPESTLRGWCKSEHKLRIQLLKTDGFGDMSYDLPKYSNGISLANNGQRKQTNDSFKYRRTFYPTQRPVPQPPPSLPPPTVGYYPTEEQRKFCEAFGTVFAPNFSQFTNDVKSNTLSKDNCDQLMECCKNLAFMTAVVSTAIGTMQTANAPYRMQNRMQLPHNR